MTFICWSLDQPFFYDTEEVIYDTARVGKKRI